MLPKYRDETSKTTSMITFHAGLPGGVARDRRMDLIFRNAFHIFIFDSVNSWRQIEPDFTYLLEECINAIVLVHQEDAAETQVLS